MGTLVGRISYLLKRIRPAADKTRGATVARPRPAPSRKRSLRFISCMASSVSDSPLLFICPAVDRAASTWLLIGPARGPAQHIAGQAPDKDEMIRCHVDPVARTLDRTKNLARGDIHAEDPSAQRVQRARFDVFPMRDHPHFIAGRDKDVLRRAEMGPHAEKLSFGSEHLDAIILAVAYIDDTLGVELHGVGRVELAGSASGLTPFELILAVLGKLDYARVAVAIGHIEAAISREGDVG